MLLLSDFIKRIVSTNLSKTNMLDINSNSYVKPSELEKLISYINSGLTHIHTKHLILQKQQLIKLYEPVTTYHLRMGYSKYNGDSNEYYKYLEDSIETPFYPYVIKILFVYDSNGKSLNINDVNVLDSVHTESFDTLQINNNTLDPFVNVVYQADHVPVISSNLDTQYIYLPNLMIDMLSYYIAHLYFLDQLGTKNLQQSQIYQTKYLTLENTCIERGLIYNYQTTNLKAEYKGFV